jgi:hypothetical protein
MDDSGEVERLFREWRRVPALENTYVNTRTTRPAGFLSVT